MGHPTGVMNTFRGVRFEGGAYVRGLLNGPDVSLDDRQRRAVAAIRRDGYAVLENYWPRDRALAVRDRLEAKLADHDVDFDEGAYLRVWQGRSVDEGVSRLYHVEKLLPELEELRHDRFCLDVATAYYRQPFYSGVLMFQHNVQTNENTRYYHVDAFSREFKAFLYLDDVDEGNGPFTYLRGTHRSYLRRLRKQAAPGSNGSPTGFPPEQLGRLLKREDQISAPAGTLILTDVRGFHRGSPQRERSRSVLVNYILSGPGDLHLER